MFMRMPENIAAVHLEILFEDSESRAGNKGREVIRLQVCMSADFLEVNRLF